MVLWEMQWNEKLRGHDLIDKELLLWKITRPFLNMLRTSVLFESSDEISGAGRPNLKEILKQSTSRDLATHILMELLNGTY